MNKENVIDMAAEEMAEWENTAPTGDAEGQDTEEDLILTFGKPYVFEGQTYTELDLSGLEETNGGTLDAVGRAVRKKVRGLNEATLEMTMEYALYMAQRVTRKPAEFFDRMPARERIRLKGIVVGFLFGGDGDN